MTRNCVLSVAIVALLAAPAAFSQQSPSASSTPTGTPPQHDHMGMRPGGPDHGGMGMGILPPGLWWKNPATVAALTLTADQQKRLDDIFQQNRIALGQLHSSLSDEQSKLEPLLNANPPDQARSLAQISKIADLRASLEKADAKMLLSLRAVLTADQWTKLQATDNHGQQHGPGGPGAGHHGPQGSSPQ